MVLLKRTEPARTMNPAPVPMVDNSIRLTLQISGPKGRNITLKLKNRLLIGSGSAHWDLDLDLAHLGGMQAGVSRQHLAFTTDGDIVLAEDLNSDSGTRINGVLMHPERKIRVRTGDELALGDLLMTVRIVRAS